jgi:hypothetical protein
MVHGLTPIRPGVFGNQSSYGLELAYRVATCTLALFSSLATIPLWAAGGLVDRVGDAIKTKPYTYWKGKDVLADLIKKELFLFDTNLCQYFNDTNLRH